MRELKLFEFLTESNFIEREPEPNKGEIFSALKFLDNPSLETLKSYVHATSGASIRNKPTMNVRVGDHVAPQGGDSIPIAVEMILDAVIENKSPIYAFKHHVEYETLHPFMDGNGRSGRLIWYFQMKENAPIGFLQQWYYQTLSFGEIRT